MIEIKIWSLFPDAYTFLSKLGKTDIEYLKMCWENRDLKKIDKFLDLFSKVSKCKGCLSLAYNLKGNKFPGFSSSLLFRLEIKLNYPEKDDEIDFETSLINVSKLLEKAPHVSMKMSGITDYISLYYYVKRLDNKK